MATQTGSIDLKGMTSAYSDQQQYFWVESNSSATWGGGAHITNIAESAFKTAAGTWGTDPTAGGYNLLMNTDTVSGTGSLQLRNGALPIMNLDNDSLDFNIMDSTTTPYTTINVAQFGANGARIGDANGAHSIIDDKGQRFYATNGITQLANIGYDSGTSEGGTAIAPYYTFGVRQITTTAYNPSSTYSVGDMCVYDEKVYVCVHDITTPESWYANNWRYYIGNYSMAEGYNTTASGYASHAAGEKTTATGLYSHAEGYDTIASGQASHAEGNWTEASWTTSHAEGQQTKASGYSSHAEGYGSTASGRYSHAEGYNTTASGWYSHAEGSHTTASDFEAHAEGDETTASGQVSHAEGIYTIASASVSHAEGHTTIASGNMAHAQNESTIAAKKSQTSLGTYNVEDTATTTTHPDADPLYGQHAVIIGNGTDNTRSNAATIQWDGTARLAGDVYVGCNADSTGGTKVLTDLSGMFVMSGEAVSTGSVSAQSNKYDTTAIEKSGKWLPIAITGYYSSGTNISGINVYNMYLSDRTYDSTNNKGKANIHWGIRNVLQSGTLNATISFQVLWAKVS